MRLVLIGLASFLAIVVLVPVLTTKGLPSSKSTEVPGAPEPYNTKGLPAGGEPGLTIPVYLSKDKKVRLTRFGAVRPGRGQRRNADRLRAGGSQGTGDGGQDIHCPSPAGEGLVRCTGGGRGSDGYDHASGVCQRAGAEAALERGAVCG